MTLNIPGTDEPKTVVVPWTKPPHVKRRKIYSVENGVLAQPIRSKARTRLLTGMAQGRLWLEQLINGSVVQIDQLATQYGVRRMATSIEARQNTDQGPFLTFDEPTRLTANSLRDLALRPAQTQSTLTRLAR